MSSYDESLKFDELWQDAMVGYMFKEYSFFLRCRKFLKPEWFQNPITSEIVNKLFSLYDKISVKRLVTKAEVEGALAQIHIEPQVMSQYRTKLTMINTATENVGLDILAKDMTSWIRIVKLHNSITESANLFNKREYDKVPEWLKGKIQDIMQTSFEKDDKVDFTDAVEFFEKRDEILNDCCTIGHPDFDEILRKGCKLSAAGSINPFDLRKLTVGSLVKGDTTVLIGATNSGKTSSIISIVNSNLSMGKDVLLITHEQTSEEIKAKVFQNMCGFDNAKLGSLKLDPEAAKKVQMAGHFINKHLDYISYTVPGEMFVENVINIITLYQERRIAVSGRGFDLVVVDYPGKLKSKIYQNRHSSGWEEQSYVYDQFMIAARHFRFHILLPCQTNRDGFKANRDGDRQVDLGDVAGAFATVQGADNVIIINRSDSDKATGRIRYVLAKSRLSATGSTFVSKTDLSRSRTHGLTLASTIIAPGLTMDEQTLMNIFDQQTNSISMKMGGSVF